MATEPATDFRIERRPKLSEHVVSALRDQILGGQIAPGQKLPTEGQMTETFGVSRTVIREAVASLAADGLVEARQGAGVFVLEHPTLTFGSFNQEIRKVSQAINVLEVRMGIEIESAGLAAVRRNAAQEARDPGGFLRVRAAAQSRRADRQGRFRLPSRDRLGDQQPVLRRDPRRARRPHHSLRPEFALVFGGGPVDGVSERPAARAPAHPEGDLGGRSGRGPRGHARASHRRHSIATASG